MYTDLDFAEAIHAAFTQLGHIPSHREWKQLRLKPCAETFLRRWPDFTWQKIMIYILGRDIYPKAEYEVRLTSPWVSAKQRSIIIERKTQNAER